MSRVALAAEPREAARLEGGLAERGHRIALRRASAVELAEALDRAGDEDVDAIVVTATRRCLSADLIAMSDRRGIRVVAVAAGSHGHRLAARVGLYEVVDAEAGMDAVERMLTPSAAGSARGAVRGAAGAGARAAGTGGDGPAEGGGTVIAVWGPTGAPGRSSLATALAAEFALRVPAVALGDVDPYGGSIATALGLLDEAPGFAAACRLAGSGALTLAELDRVASVHVGRPGSIRVLTGISRTSRWPELSDERVGAVIARCRDWVPVTVLDTGFGIEADEELSSDVFAPRRNAATLAAVRAADRVIVVGAADPVGMSRLVRAVAELREAAPAADPVVVVNRVRAGIVGPSPAHQVRTTLERFAGVTPAALVPDDPAAFDRALLTGQTLVDAAPRSAARIAVRRLADFLVPTEGTAAAPARRRARRGRSVPRVEEAAID